MIRNAMPADAPNLCALWEKCFPGEPGFTELFFGMMYKPEYCRVFDMDGQPIAMLHAFPYDLRTPDGKLSTYYIYGVGCDPDYRGRGYAGALVKNAIERAREESVDLCMLIPQNDGLFDYYGKFGFSPAFYIDTIETAPDDNTNFSFSFRPAAPDILDEINSVYESALSGYIHAARDKKHWEMLLQGARLSGGDICVADAGGISAYAVYHIEDKTLVIDEMFRKDGLVCRGFPDYLAARKCCETIRLTRPGTGKRLGAVYYISDRARAAFDNTPGYLNLMHN